MKKNTRNLLIGVGIVAALSLVLFLLLRREPGPRTTGSAPKQVRVALNLPLTGPFAIYGQTVRDGALLAVDDVRTRNVNVNLDIQDNAGTTNGALTVFQRQSLQNFDIYSSGVKPQTMAIFDRVVGTGRPYFVWVFDAAITDQHPSVLRTWVNYKYEPEKYFQYIRCRQARKVAIAAVNLPHTLDEFQRIVIPRLQAEGIEPVLEIYDLGTRQHRDVLLKLSAQRPDLYILNGFQEDLVAFSRAMRSLGLFVDGNTIGTYDLLDAAPVLGSETIEGFRVVTPQFSMGDSVAGAWKQQFRTRFGREPLYTDAYSYDMIQVVADAATRLTLPATPAQWLQAIQATDRPGVTGRLRFDQGGDLILDLKIGVYRGGRLTADACEVAQ